MTRVPANKKNFHLKPKKKEPQLKLWHKLLFLSPILIIALIFKGNEWYKKYRLENYGEKTFATITKVSMSGVRDPLEIENVAFEYKVDDSIYFGYTIAETNTHYAFANNGLPLSEGDKYLITYDTENPELVEIKLDEPDQVTLNYYFNQAAIVIKKQNIFKNSDDPEKSIACFIQNVFSLFSFDGIATILFSDEYLAENLSNNAISYRQFMDKKEIKELIKTCSQ